MQNARPRSAAIALAAVAIVITLWPPTPTVFAQTPPSSPPPAPRVFQEEDAVRLMDHLRQALGSENRSRTLKLFDASRMPAFPVFRDELSQFFARNQPPSVDYHIQQVSQDGALGAIIAEVVMEAAPWTDGQPALRRRAQVHLIANWDGKEWKIADFSPRSFFQ